MTVSPLSLSLTVDVDLAASWPDEVVDLTDRRRLLVLAVLGVDVSGAVADDLFGPLADQRTSSSTTIRSEGRAPSTDAT